MGKDKREARAKREADAAMAKELDDDSESLAMSRAAAKLTMKPAVDNGAEELFEKKLTKEEKKELAAKRKAEREARKAAEKAADGGQLDVSAAPNTAIAAPKSSKKAVSAETKAEKVKRDQALLDEELEMARVNAVRVRNEEGAYLGQIDAPAFTLPNPGGGPDLLESASFTMQRGRSYALVGRNGCGKSTLLKAMAARRVGAIPAAVTVHYVSQEVLLTEKTLAMTPVDVVVNADVERRLLIEERDALIAAEARGEAIDGERLQGPGGVLELLQDLETDTVETRATQLLANLGFSEELRARPMSALSGGWRVRTMLAAAIFGRPDMLLLDEPTNHLSIGAVLWLARELKTNPVWEERIVCVVSHDRFFLDEVCSDVLHVSGVAKRLTQTHGSYSTWAKRRAEQQKAFARTVELRRQEIAELKSYAGHGFKYGGSSASINKMQMKGKQAEKLEEEDAEQAEEFAALSEDMELPLNLKAGGELDGFLIQLMGVGFGYPGGKTLFSGAEMSIDSKSRIVLLGENGNGKTTLVKLITAALEPSEGEIRRNAQCRIAIVNQHHADQIDLQMTPHEFMRSKFPGDGSNAHDLLLRTHLDRMGVPTVKQGVPAYGLSGGQRSRVALAAVSYVEPHILILDEPTNNLDLESVAALADAVESFKGGVILVSHDQYFVGRVAKEVWVVANGTVKEEKNGFDAYRARQLRRLAAPMPVAIS
jgi:ATP-binding cassette subfamily F protein 3